MYHRVIRSRDERTDWSDRLGPKPPTENGKLRLRDLKLGREGGREDDYAAVEESVGRENTRDGISLWGKEDRQTTRRWDDEELKKALQHWGVLKHMGARKAPPPPHEGERTQISI